MNEMIQKKLSLLPRQFRVALKLLSRRIDHEEVVQHVREEGMLSARFLFMTLMSCAIAILGLLLSSPAVVIGAMLISPLMGPIMLMGFSLSILEIQSLRRAMFSMFCGVVAALAISFLIVKLSPLTDATPEIIARTRPNFFDLLVALFSGLAGGYAVIHRKGETIVGVAIATALMPPLAVTGYGLAVGSMPVAGGAFFLFMTNLLTIALSVTVLSKIYGFGEEHSPRHTLWQSALIFLVFVALSVPLGLALRDIAYESRVTSLVRGELLRPFEGTPARVGDVSVAFPRNSDIQVNATILTRTRVPAAEARLSETLNAALEKRVQVNLDQVLVDEDRGLDQAQFLELAENSLAAPLRAEISLLNAQNNLRVTEAQMRRALPLALAGADIDAEALTATYFAAPEASLDIAAYRRLEQGLRETYPDWDILLVPPVMDLPLVPFDQGGEDLSKQAVEALELTKWALEHWGVQRIEVVGYASTAGSLQNFNNQALAFRRAEAAAEWLRAEGFEAEPVGEYRAFRQDQAERQLGRQRFQSVLVRPAT